MNEEKEVAVLAGAVHGALAFGHLLGIAYNARRGNGKQTLIHLGAFLFDLYAVKEHIKDAREAE